MKFRPCIDLHSGKVKQLVGGTLSDDEKTVRENFVSEKDAGYYAGLYRSFGLAGGHIIMLGPGNEEPALKALKAFPGGMQIGGGINPGNAEIYLKAGATHVIVTSWVFREGRIDYDRLEQMTAAAGKKQLVLDLSCRKKPDGRYYVVTDLWQKFTETPVNPETLNELSSRCNEFLIHAVDVEGKQSGIETALIETIAEGSPVPVTYAGGIRSLNDIKLIEKIGGGKLDFTVGSALDIFGGQLPFSILSKNYGAGHYL